MSDRTVRARIKTMKWIIEGLEEDAEKHAKGQKAAGTRVRKALQEIRAEAQVARVQILKEQKDPDSIERRKSKGRRAKARTKARARGASTRLDLGLSDKPRAKRSQGWNALSEHLRF